jgi:hypothetical protein
MKNAGLTTLGNSLSVSLGILFFGWSDSVASDKLRTLRLVIGSENSQESEIRLRILHTNPERFTPWIVSVRKPS